MKLTAASKLSYTEQYMTLDGEPFFPVMGEIHYSRVPSSRWKEELLKMKAGGVDIISAYSIWIHHEEGEGEWNFDGNCNLRLFLETIKECGLYCFLRIGPWAHGEVRNGGFPDWLMEKEKTEGIRLRSNDPKYLSYVRVFYEKLWEQTEGLLLSDNGPVIGIQIENEYGHCGGLQGEEGEEHMRTLRSMAEEIGFRTPLYTATGWGGAVTGGMLPVMGGYCEAPWDQRITELEPSGNYIFTKERNDHNIGSDHGIGAGITFDMDRFPYLTAELGGGLQVTRHRRPVATAKDTAVMTWVKLGSGCNLLGYYMYHGGTNPDGRYSTLQESKATGSLNDLPVKSYDFNAPIREYGQLTDTYREIRRITMFAKDYQNILCRASYVDQPGNPDKAENLESLRTAVRYTRIQGRPAGFCFLNNYQRRYKMADQGMVTPKAYDEEGQLLAEFPEEHVAEGDYRIYPFGLPLGEEAVLKSANAAPLCILKGEAGSTYVFYTKGNAEPVYEIEGSLGENRILTLTDEEALHAFKSRRGNQEYLLISEDDLIENEDGSWQMLSAVQEQKVPEVLVYPALAEAPAGFVKFQETGNSSDRMDSTVFEKYRYADTLINPVRAELGFVGQTASGDLTASLSVSRIPSEQESGSVRVDQAMLYLDYEGESAELSRDGILRADNFYTGQVWEIGCTDFAERGSCIFDLTVHPLKPDTPVFLETWPGMKEGKACRIQSVKAAVIYQIML